MFLIYVFVRLTFALAALPVFVALAALMIPIVIIAGIVALFTGRNILKGKTDV
jgi:hypothetical protein